MENQIEIKRPFIPNQAPNKALNFKSPPPMTAFLKKFSPILLNKYKIEKPNKEPASE